MRCYEALGGREPPRLADCVKVDRLVVSGDSHGPPALHHLDATEGHRGVRVLLVLHAPLPFVVALESVGLDAAVPAHSDESVGVAVNRDACDCVRMEL